MNFKEVINNKYSGYSRGQIAAINYYEYLASTNGVDISDQAVETFLDSIKSQQKRDINAYFFKTSDASKPTPEMSKKEVSELADNYKEFADSKRKEQVDTLKQKMTNAKGMITRRQNEIATYLKEYHEHKTKLDVFEGRKADWFRVEIEKIIKDPFWKFHGKGDKWIDFTTRTNIVLQEAAAKYTLNFGKYRIRLHIDGLYCTVHTHENNLIYGEDTIHPYCQIDNEMCYGGEGAAQAYKFSQNGELYKLFTLIKNTLTYYNPSSSPYTTLHDFKRYLEEFKTRDKQPDASSRFTCCSCGERYHEDDRAQEDWCQSCWDEEHFYCEPCDEYYHNDDFGDGPDGVTLCRSCLKEHEAEKEREEKEKQLKEAELTF
jgi:hypothetical protein